MKIYLLILTFILFSCSNNEGENPKNILSETVLENILKDIHLAEAAFEIDKNKDIENANAKLANDYFNIYKRHEIVEDDFKKAINHYSKNPEKLEQIYTNILERLTKEKSKFDQQ